MTEQDYQEYIRGQLEAMRSILLVLSRFLLTEQQCHTIANEFTQALLEELTARDDRRMNTSFIQEYSDFLTDYAAKLDAR